MRRFIILTTVMWLGLAAYAQTDSTNIPETQMRQDTSLVIRKGNTYIAGGSVMNKREFLGYLQSRDAVSYKKFRSGYTISNVGWGLFGGGLVVGVAGFTIAMAGGFPLAVPMTLTQPKGSDNKIVVGTIMWFVGEAVEISGIVCLGVGYGRMHKAARLYNSNLTNSKPVVTFNLQSSENGIGIAMNF